MAICIYPGDASDLSGNGLGILRPTSCIVRQEAGGLYELEMTHPITGDNRWALIQKGCLIKAPTPTAQTPNLEIYHEGTPEVPGTPERLIWRVNITTAHANGYSRIYQRANTDSRVLKKLRNGTEYEYLGAVGSNWHKAVSADGISGYMYTANSVYARTEPEIKPQAGSPGWSTVVKPRQVREQLFRVVDTAVDTEKMEKWVLARHVSYDLLKNVITQYKGEGVAPAIALGGLADNLVSPYEGEFYTDIVTPVTVDWQVKNGISALLDPEEGLLHKAAPTGRLVRDNWDWFLLAPQTVDRGLTLRYGKNLLGVHEDSSAADTVTRLVPYGEDKEGNLLLLPEVYVDAEDAGSYPVTLTAALEVGEAKEKEASGDDAAVTKEDCYRLMREACTKAYQDGANGLDVTLTVDFLHLGDTVEYAAYKDLQQAHLYDTIHLWESRVGMEIQAQAIAYEFDAILERYQSMTVGRLGQGEKASIASWQLPDGGIAGTKLALGSVIGNRLRDLSITNAKLGNATITYAKIAQACIALLNADAIKALIAELEKVIAGTIETNELYAQIIKAVTASLDKVTSGQITTNDLYAQIIKAVVLEIGKVTAGQVETNELYAQIISAAAAELGKVTADTVDANELYASLVKALKADLARVTSGAIETSELFAVLASVVNLTAETADIDFARIKDLVTGEAIITEGVGGKLFIARLTVTDLQVVSAITQELVVKGEDGRYYQLTIVDGALVPVEVAMSGEQLQEGTTPGTALVENAITTRELNATQIFADEALMTTLFAGMGTFGEIFAQSAVMPFITTSVIESEAFRLAVASGGIEWVDELPEEPVTGKYYVDNSVSPPVIRRWDGEAWATINDTEEIQRALTDHSSQLTALNDAVELRVTRTEYDAALAEKADQTALSATETSLRQDISGWQARIEATEGDVTTLKLGVEVTEDGVTIRQPNKTSNQMQLAADSITISAPGREALVISPQESYMPSLRVSRFVRGNLVTTVSGTGPACRVVDQYVE
ncbi:MAG: hypothetical protein IJ461_07330 [Clostridia bacterium]|nr:hypothetical protein [Clostridia bacterium]